MTQIKRGTLEYAVLSKIDIKENYGYDIVTTLDQWDILSTKEGLIQSVWKSAVEGLSSRKLVKAYTIDYELTHEKLPIRFMLSIFQ